MTGIGPLTLLDLALIAIVAISALAAMYRGLTREVLSILSWAVAAIAVFYFVRYHRDIAEAAAKQFTDPAPSSYVIVAQVIMGGVIFLIVLILVHLVTARISDTVLDSRIGAIDRVLGLVFGALRGFIIVVIPFMFYESFFPKEDQQYPWVRNALFQPYIKGTGNTLKTFLESLVPSQLRGTGEQRQGSNARPQSVVDREAALLRRHRPPAGEHAPGNQGHADARAPRDWPPAGKAGWTTAEQGLISEPMCREGQPEAAPRIGERRGRALTLTGTIRGPA